MLHKNIHTETRVNKPETDWSSVAVAKGYSACDQFIGSNDEQTITSSSGETSDIS